MNNSFFYYLRVFAAIFLVIIYLAFSGLVTVGLEKPTVTIVVRHAIFVTGLVPALCWITLLVSRKFHLRFLLITIFITVFHVFVFAVSAHKDGFFYWGIQSLEFVALAFTLWRFYIVNNKTKMRSSR
jgi:hypothetical protein